MPRAINAPTPDFGLSWSCITDVTMPAVMVSGFRVIAEAIVRRWSTPNGGLVDDPNYGTDLTDAVSDDMTITDISQLAQQAGAEAEKDERVLSADVTITLNAGTLLIVGNIDTAKGPFQLVASVNTVTVALLQVTP